MNFIRQFLLTSALLTLLYFGLTGVEGAYNVFATVICVSALVSTFMYSDSYARHVHKELAAKTKDGIVRRPKYEIIYRIINFSMLFVLVWFGKFIIAALLIYVLIGVEVVWTRIARLNSQRQLVDLYAQLGDNGHIN